MILQLHTSCGKCLIISVMGGLLDCALRVRGYIWTIVAIWRKNMLGYLSADIICSEKRTVFRERSSRKTVSYKEQFMSKDKYPSIFSPQMATIVFIILEIFFATRAIFTIGEYSRIFPSFSWGIFGHVTCLGQSRAAHIPWWLSQWKLLNYSNDPVSN